MRLIHKDKSVKRLFLNLSKNGADLILKIPLDEFGITKLSPKSSNVLMLGDAAALYLEQVVESILSRLCDRRLFSYYNTVLKNGS